MAIQALPVRLGEFVRPYFVVRTGQSRMSAVLGTVAVERIVDGLLISIIFFASYLVSDRGSLVGGAGAGGLGVAAGLRRGDCCSWPGRCGWPEPTIHLALSCSLLPWLAAPAGGQAARQAAGLIQGFGVLREPRYLLPFLLQSVLYWGTNGFGMWLLAQGMKLPMSPVAAYAAMSFTGVLISLPNSPGLVGQFHLGVVVALAAYLPDERPREGSRAGLRHAPARDPADLVHACWASPACLSCPADGGRCARRWWSPTARPGRSGSARRQGGSMTAQGQQGEQGKQRAGPVTGAVAGLGAGTAAAQARSTSVLPYPQAEVWPTAIRFLRIDRGASLREKDAESGYVLFDLPEGGKAYKGSLGAGADHRCRGPRGHPGGGHA